MSIHAGFQSRNKTLHSLCNLIIFISVQPFREYKRRILTADAHNIQGRYNQTAKKAGYDPRLYFSFNIRSMIPSKNLFCSDVSLSKP